MQTKPLKLYYVMYKTSQPSSAKYSCSERIVSCKEYFQQKHENSDVSCKLVDVELTKQSVEVSCWLADNCSVNKSVSVSESDATDVNSNVQVLTVAKPDWHYESYAAAKLENFEAEASTTTDGAVRPVESKATEQVTSGEMLNCVSSSIGTHVAASSEPSNDSSSIVESVVNNGNNESFLHHDSIPQKDVSSELASEEKIGFEPDAITATDQWPSHSPVVERRVKRLQSEVQRLMFDENGRGMRRELRTSDRRLRKIRRSPLQRLRTMVSLRPSIRHPSKLSSRVDSMGN